MLAQLHNLLLDTGLVEGSRHPSGWGAVVRRQIIPLLDHPKLRQHRDILEEGFARVDEPLSVFVVGEGNFGKSTLVNALLGLGVEVARSDFLPLTWHITRYVPETRGERFEIHYEPSHSGAGRLETAVQSLGERAETAEAGLIRCESPDDIDELIAREEDERKSSGAASAIWQVVRSVPEADAAVRSLELVDSPGISQVRDGAAAGESIEDFYHRADVVLWLVAADKTNSKETRRALESMSRYGKPIIGVVNRADLIPADQRERVHSDVTDRFDGLLQDVLLVSARDGFQAAVTQNEQLLTGSGLARLRNSIERLAGAAGQRTKALSLYNTSRQAAGEAATILRQEADVLESNITEYRKNLTSADSFFSRGKKIVKQTLKGQSGVIASACRKAMKKSFKPYGDESTPLWDDDAFTAALRKAKGELIDRINAALKRELAAVQDEIAVREYRVQSYRGDATVRSHDSRTSLALRLTEVEHTLQDYEWKPSWDPMDYLINFVQGVKKVFRGLFGVEQSAAEIREEQKESRTRALNACIRGLKDLEQQVHDHVKSGAESATHSAVAELTSEINDCFTREFGYESEARQQVADSRGQAKVSVVPPAISYSVMSRLRVNGHSAVDRNGSPRSFLRDASRTRGHSTESPQPVPDNNSSLVGVYSIDTASA